jgi:hypothetical protein
MKIGIVGIVMLVVFSILGYVGNRLDTDRATITKLTTQNQQQKDALVAAEDVILKLKTSSEITVTTLTTFDTKKITTSKKREERIAVVVDKVELISTDTLTLSPEQRAAISKTYVASLWQEYCFATNVNETCVAANTLPGSPASIAPPPLVLGWLQIPPKEHIYSESAA